MTGPYKATADRFAAVVTKINADERTLEIFREFVREAEVSEVADKLDIPISTAEEVLRLREAGQEDRAIGLLKAYGALQNLINDPSWLTEDLLNRDLPEIDPATEAEFLAGVESDLDEHYGPKKG